MIDPSRIELPNRAVLIREAVRRRGLHEFLRRFWTIADPKCPGFVDNWHFGAKAEILTAVSKRQIRNVVINEPPGMGKSLTVDVLWQAWHWGPFGDPKHAWMSISFDHSLVLRNARQLIDVVSSPLYKACWPEFNLGGRKRAEGEFFNGHGGYRFSTSFDGKGTGRHVNTQVLDDPIKPKEEFNARALKEANEKWNGTFSTRRIDPLDFARVIIMQRIAENDTAGEMLEEQGYEHLCLPMRYEPACYWDRGNSLNVKDQRTQPGELLFPARFPEDAVKKEERALGSPARVSAQFQQNPTPQMGGIIEKAWFKTWDVLPKDIRLIQSWDFGFKKKPGQTEEAELIQSGRSRVSGTLYGEQNGRSFFIDEIRPVAMSFPESKRAFLQAQKGLWLHASLIVIEDKANGTGIIDDLEYAVEQALRAGKQVDPTLLGLIQKIERVNPTEDKLTRLIRHTDYIHTGQLLIPCVEQCSTVDDWIVEIVGFPRRKWNDRVDTLTQALDFLRAPYTAYRNALGNLRRTRR